MQTKQWSIKELANYIIRICDRVSEDTMVDERLPDGTVTHFNISQYNRVMFARGYSTKDNEIPNHYLKGQKIIDQDGNILTVNKVAKYWDCGFYLVIMFEQSPNFYLCIVWENINSISPVVTERINATHKQYRQVICNMNM